ncbi:MAG: GNAT family N-acetyltransferase [Chloroflexota bacterium]|nr:MAG: GNAT family N-acetyltransferase [Chloroflexota bacterium]
MEFTIKEIEHETVADMERIDDVLRIDKILVVHTEEYRLVYTVEEIPPYEKRYPRDPVDYHTYVHHPDRAIFLAYAGDQVAGMIILRKNWNNYAYIEYVTVDSHFRGQGAGVLLMERGKEWAREKGLPGIMLETQNNNTRACRLYERCGFVLGGFDRYLYKAVMPGTTEIALYWYYLFESNP